ncbi:MULTISPECIES: hypothetical protein [unclassified Gilliamella]|uniref:hypothetical protein n=1 Tax=unclassified Gilliamella TaxID=2685620 RepID=UPI00130B785E|nr:MULTISPECIES: hypothetical protein [unclassified Gilliamella]MWP49136.1 hypothetical protein [Gilliamella sp. Lep-s35]MWP69250.1 hypothetical protein [Gilliamella sp. Lep-s5]MWP76813.1 hypothetical protein [Gilliamella sp. Lep-s21]
MKMIKKTASVLVACLLLLQGCGQAPKTDKQIIKETMQAIEIPKQYQQEPFYYAGIYSANIKWELFINDTQTFAHYQGKITSPIVPLNYNILGSGKQKLTIRMYPPNGQTVLGEYAAFRLRLYYRKNFRDKKVPEIPILDFELPYEQTKDLPYFEKSFEFEAQVPYQMTGWTKSKDLTKVPDLEQKVVKKIEALRTILENKDTEAYFQAVMPRSKEQFICLYATQQEIENSFQEDSLTNGQLSKILDDIQILPITDYQIILEPHNRIVKLRQKDDDSFTDGIKFKAIDKEDKKEITGGYYFRFHIPEGSDELEVIR